MAIVVTTSNHYKYQLAKKLIDLSADSIKVILMDSAFAFDKDAHPTLASVTANQLSTEYGYTQDTKALTSVVVTEDDTEDEAGFACDDVSWTASAGSIGPTGAVVFYDDDTADDTVIGCADFGADYTITDTMTFYLKDISIPVT